MNTLSEVIIHHSAGPRTQSVESIRRYHVEDRGWSDIGYHYVIDGQARRHVGRQIPKRGAHAPPNTGRIGICVTGDNTTWRSAWTESQVEALRALCRDLRSVMPWLVFRGHRDVMRPGYTECPGVDVWAILPEFVEG